MTADWNPLIGILCAPLISAAILAAIPSWKASAWINIASSFATFAFSLRLFYVQPEAGLYFFIDDFNIYLVVLTAFVGGTTSIFSMVYIWREVRIHHMPLSMLRFYHAMYQAFMFTMLLALTANNIGILWGAIEAATLTTVLMVSLYRTRPAIEAAWKYFILCSVGIGLALFGTTLMYLAAQPVLGAGESAMQWTTMMGVADKFQPDLVSLAFVFLLVGYGTKVGLAPLHAWLPDAHAEGPTPISAILSGLLLNVALYAILRFKMLLAGNEASLQPGPLMIFMGCSSVLIASFMMYRRGDIKRLFAYSSIEHMGIMTFAFGMGGAMANFAGLMHMTMHSLVKSAIFFAVGFITQAAGTQRIADIRGLTASRPLLGWIFVFAVLAIAGMPPFGVFMSEFLVITSTFYENPFLAAPVMLGLLVTFAALIVRLQGMAFGEPSRLPGWEIHKPPHMFMRILGYLPLFAHLALALIAGLYLPEPLVRWFQSVSELLG